MSPADIINDLLTVYSDPMARKALLDARRRIDSYAVDVMSERDEAVKLLTDTTVRGGTCDLIDSDDAAIFLDDPIYHECSDVDEHQAAKCWEHQRRAFLFGIGHA